MDDLVRGCVHVAKNEPALDVMVVAQKEKTIMIALTKSTNIIKVWNITNLTAKNSPQPQFQAQSQP